jgi:hypothetical protein
MRQRVHRTTVSTWMSVQVRMAPLAEVTTHCPDGNYRRVTWPPFRSNTVRRSRMVASALRQSAQRKNHLPMQLADTRKRLPRLAIPARLLTSAFCTASAWLPSEDNLSTLSFYIVRSGQITVQSGSQRDYGCGGSRSGRRSTPIA